MHQITEEITTMAMSRVVIGQVRGGTGIRGGCLEEEEPELGLKEAFQIEGDSTNQGMEKTRSTTRVPLCFGHWCAGKHLTTGSRNKTKKTLTHL